MATVPAGQTWIVKWVALAELSGRQGITYGLHLARGGTEWVVDELTSDVNGVAIDRAAFIVVKGGDVVRLAKTITLSTTLVYLAGARLLGLAS